GWRRAARPRIPVGALQETSSRRDLGARISERRFLAIAWNEQDELCIRRRRTRAAERDRFGARSCEGITSLIFEMGISEDARLVGRPLWGKDEARIAGADCAHFGESIAPSST